jgi:signal transduction histidine kinase/ligand-binding sensor domain-containing protein
MKGPQGFRAAVLVLLSLFFLPHEEAFNQVLPFQFYGTKDGLVSDNALTLFQDSEGFLWIGTAEGVSSFDGWTFTNYTASDGLPHTIVRRIIEEKGKQAKSLLILSMNGVVSRIVQGKLEPVQIRSLISTPHKITAICVDHTGTLWVGTDDTLGQIIGNELRPVSTGIRMRYVSLIVQGTDSTLWIVCRNNLYYYSPDTKEFGEVNLDHAGDVRIRAAAVDPDGSFWISLDPNLILQIHNRTVVHELATRSKSGTRVLVSDPGGYLWFGDYDGLYRVPKNNLTSSAVERVRLSDNPSEHLLKSGLVDVEGNFWFASTNKGIARIGEKNLYRFAIEGINPPYHYAISVADSNNHIWVVARSGLWEIWKSPTGTWHKSLQRVEQGKGNAKHYPVFDTGNELIHEGRPYSVVCDRLGRLWIGFSNAQIACFRVHPYSDKPSRLELVRTLRPDVDFPSAFPKCFLVDRNDLLWYCLGNRLVLLFDLAKPQPLVRTFDSLDGGNYSRALYQDVGGNLWAGSFGGGVARLDADSIRTGSFREVFASSIVASITGNAEGDIMVATEFGGLTVLGNDGSVKRHLSKDIPSNIVYAVTEERGGRMWISTAAGVAYLDSLSALKSVQKPELKGFTSLSSGVTRNGVVWFVTSEGLIVADAFTNPIRQLSFPVVLTKFRLNGRDTTFREGMHMSFDQNNLSFEFVSVTFRYHQEVSYLYRLREGDNWNPAPASRSLTLADLPAGKYALAIKAVHTFDAQSAQSVTFSFIITPPFWKTWWFTTLAFVSLLLSVGGTIRYVEKRKLMRRIEQLENERAIERERARISQDMHDEVGASLSEIAILSELAKKKPEEADVHVQEISERAAEVIDNVSEIVWAMNPKNDTLDNLVAHLRRYAVKYLSLAQINCKFTAPDVIPAHHLTAEVRRNLFLVVKEALHNVVKHAGASEVSITTTLVDTKLEITIEDNGRGFSVEQSQQSGDGLASMSKRVTDIGGKFQVESQPGKGTRVEVRLPNSKY